MSLHYTFYCHTSTVLGMSLRILKTALTDWLFCWQNCRKLTLFHSLSYYLISHSWSLNMQQYQIGFFMHRNTARWRYQAIFVYLLNDFLVLSIVMKMKYDVHSDNYTILFSTAFQWHKSYFNHFLMVLSCSFELLHSSKENSAIQHSLRRSDAISEIPLHFKSEGENRLIVLRLEILTSKGT